MPGGKSFSKHSGKPTKQLLFPEALQHSLTMTDQPQETAMDCILQEISAVGRRLEGMDSMMVSLMEDTKSLCLDITGLQSRVTSLEQRVTTV
ncbi:hypothetical protein NDU88_002052 [Pleurodeles waltl]|uniref:Uncharacterized protein n=1 Tax=Pleurodeles waltl TaxID=8319 RepID=A0AAV7LCS0_PLEWA|nr:hypothetical protein NDU88_002052 [Pleurodeles waltl]